MKHGVTQDVALRSTPRWGKRLPTRLTHNNPVTHCITAARQLQVAGGSCSSSVVDAHSACPAGRQTTTDQKMRPHAVRLYEIKTRLPGRCIIKLDLPYSHKPESRARMIFVSRKIVTFTEREPATGCVSVCAGETLHLQLPEKLLLALSF